MLLSELTYNIILLEVVAIYLYTYATRTLSTNL